MDDPPKDNRPPLSPRGEIMLAMPLIVLCVLATAYILNMSLGVGDFWKVLKNILFIPLITEIGPPVLASFSICFICLAFFIVVCKWLQWVWKHRADNAADVLGQLFRELFRSFYNNK